MGRSVITTRKDEPMTEETVAQATPEVTPIEVKEDLMSRVSKVKLTSTPKAEKADNPFGLTKDDYDYVNSDPSLSKLYKSMQSDYGKKTQEISELRKTYEAKMADATNWTPEKIQQVMNDQKFVEAASQVLKAQPPKDFNGTSQEWSALNDTEKREFSQLKQGYQQMSMQLALEQQRKQDDTLKTKFNNYEPQAVDTITNELLQGKRLATREDIWKVYDYENAVKRAYELGKQDRQPEAMERANASSYDGMTVNKPSGTDAPRKEEHSQQAFKRIMLDNLAKFKQRSL